MKVAQADAKSRSLIDDYLEEACQFQWMQTVRVRAFAAGVALLSLSSREQCAVVLEVARRLDELEPAGDPWSPHRADANMRAEIRLRDLMLAIMRKELPFETPEVEWLATWCLAHGRIKQFSASLLKLLESAAARGPLTPRLQDVVKQFQQTLGKMHWVERSQLSRAGQLVGDGRRALIEAGEAWSDAAIEDLGSFEAERASWDEFLQHCQNCGGGSAPSQRWAKASEALIAEIGAIEFAGRLCRWFPLVDRPRTAPRRRDSRAFEPDHTHLIIDAHADLLKGLCWACAFIPPTGDLARALGALAISCYRKVPGIGPRAVRIGNAAVWALGQMAGPDALGQLAMLRIKVKFGGAQKALEKALDAAATREGLPRDEIEELAVPAYGLSEVGRRSEQLGEITAELAITGAGETELRWRKADGKLQKSVPAAAKREHADDLKELKAAAKDIQRMLPAQRDRLDQLFIQRRAWPLETWQARYLDHPLVGTLARRLIWTVTAEGTACDVIWLDAAGGGEGGLVDRDGRASAPPPGASVELWHPLGRPVEEVLGWRRFLEERQIRQPFKQAHREIYLLTDAERATNVYSNRYAAHILRQHQFHALCAARGWKNQLRLLVDQEFPPAMRFLPQWGLRAEFWIEGAGEEYGVDTNEAGTFLHLVTDQVRFYPLEAARRVAHASGGGYATYGAEGSDTPVPLDQVPPLVFSEIMRDVDLFVGVASVGNNPDWSDGGPEGRYRDYWHDWSFGELSATAETRREILERLLPRLKIAGQCELDGRFLRVRGTRRTYRIHLGSGNILMEPGDVYLCIVPDSRQARAGAEIWLPFEGDRALALILSKALLLAADDGITDRTILSQIGG